MPLQLIFLRTKKFDKFKEIANLNPKVTIIYCFLVLEAV